MLRVDPAALRLDIPPRQDTYRPTDRTHQSSPLSDAMRRLGATCGVPDTAGRDSDTAGRGASSPARAGTPNGRTPRLGALESQVEAMRAELTELLSQARKRSDNEGGHGGSASGWTPSGGNNDSSRELYASELASARERLEAMQLRELLQEQQARRVMAQSKLQSVVRHMGSQGSLRAFHL